MQSNWLLCCLSTGWLQCLFRKSFSLEVSAGCFMVHAGMPIGQSDCDRTQEGTLEPLPESVDSSSSSNGSGGGVPLLPSIYPVCFLLVTAATSWPLLLLCTPCRAQQTLFSQNINSFISTLQTLGHIKSSIYNIAPE